MKILATTGLSDLATVYIAETEEGKAIEFVESVQPPIPREKKWVLIISTLYGCPVGCRFCDAGERYRGRLTKEEILSQIDYLVCRRFADRHVPVGKFKIQFARMGEPAFNPKVLEVLEELPELYDAPGLLPSLSTIAPAGTDKFFRRLMDIKKTRYPRNFQLQFSVHATDAKQRDWLMPVPKWSLAQIAEYGEEFYDDGGKRISLNFAVMRGAIIDPDILLGCFDPERFIIKITPVNPTHQARKNCVVSSSLGDDQSCELVETLRTRGYRVILSIGELEENRIGSNCGQYITSHLRAGTPAGDSYSYPLQSR